MIEGGPAALAAVSGRWALSARRMTALSWLLLAAACAPTLYLHYLPMVQLPQYLAASSILVHLGDPKYGFAPFYELALARGPAILPLYLMGGLIKGTTVAFAANVTAFLSVACYPLGLWALLRAQGKPIALVLLGLPVLYACPFYWGFIPSSLSLGLASLTLALLVSRRTDLRARIALLVLCVLLTFTHPLGVAIVLSYAVSATLTRTSAEPKLPWVWLTPLIAGALLWNQCALQADGVTRYDSPSLVVRFLRLPQEILGGFADHGEAYLLGAQVVLWLLLCRGASPLRAGNFRALSPSERALTLVSASCLLGYFLLPKSTWTTSAINVRMGVLVFAFLPALVPERVLRAQPARVSVLLLALGASVALYVNTNLSRFDAEARPFASVVQHVPWRSTIIGLDYDAIGKVAHSAPYLYFPAYLQAERGGFLGLSIVDVAWTVPLRRKPNARALPAVFGSEWDPSALQIQPTQFLFYDLVVVRGKDPREMTIFMNTPFKLIHRTKDWLLYAR